MITSQFCRANQLTGFYMMATLAFNELKEIDFTFKFMKYKNQAAFNNIQKCLDCQKQLPKLFNKERYY